MSASSRADGFELEEEQELETIQDRGLLLRLVRYLRPYRGQVALALLLMVAVAGLGLAGPLLVRAAIDGTLASGIPAATRYETLTRIGLIWFVILIATAGLHYIQLMVLQSTGQRVMLDLRRQLFSHLLHQDHQWTVIVMFGGRRQ
jgi:ATP-binding cassette subfamily B multidrug efflux pump